MLSPFMQIPYCHQSTEKWEIVRAYLSLGCFGDWWQCFCGLIVCIDYFRHFITRHKMIWCPSKSIADDVSLCFFGGFESYESRTIKMGSALERFGWNHHIHVCSFLYLLSLPLWSIHRFSVSLQNEGFLVFAVLWLAVLLLKGAVVS